MFALQTVVQVRACGNSARQLIFSISPARSFCLTEVDIDILAASYPQQSVFRLYIRVLGTSGKLLSASSQTEEEPLGLVVRSLEVLHGPHRRHHLVAAEAPGVYPRQVASAPLKIAPVATVVGTCPLTTPHIRLLAMPPQLHYWARPRPRPRCQCGNQRHLAGSPTDLFGHPRPRRSPPRDLAGHPRDPRRSPTRDLAGHHGDLAGHPRPRRSPTTPPPVTQPHTIKARCLFCGNFQTVWASQTEYVCEQCGRNVNHNASHWVDGTLKQVPTVTYLNGMIYVGMDDRAITYFGSPSDKKRIADLAELLDLTVRRRSSRESATATDGRFGDERTIRFARCG